MDKNIITYNFNKERYFLMIFAIMAYTAFSVFILVDTIQNDKEMFYAIEGILILGAFILIMLFITFVVTRFEMKIDEEKGTILYHRYFSKKKLYSMSELTYRIKEHPMTNMGTPCYWLWLFKDGKKLIKIETFDFEKRTKRLFEDAFFVLMNIDYNQQEEENTNE